jgi:F0F1-type ATP synthase assembly protein I
MKNKEIKNSNKNNKNPLSEYAKYSSIAFQMMVIIFGAVFGGIKLDDWVTQMDFPLFTLLFSIIGIVLAIYIAIKDFIRFK